MPPPTSKSCHNCRRRRLRCDRSWPTCNKCAVSGQECQGYGKVFVWTQAEIDGHGNVKLSPSATVAPQQRPAPTSAIAAAAGRQSTLTIRGPPAPEHHHGYREAHDQSQVHMQEQAVSDATYPVRRHSTTLGSASGHSGGGNPIANQLTDPVFQDLDRNSRYYLTHFANRVCKDLVARDTPGNNPFRDLIPLTNKHPLLLQILIATSALHWSNIFQPVGAIPPADLQDPGSYLAQLRHKDLVSRQAVIDALTAKQKAIGHMREVLDTLDPAGSEVALAAMHFFVKFDLIDLEKGDSKSWQTHLKGAGNILALLAPGQATNASTNQMLRDCVVADCFIYHVLGSTLSSGAIASRIARYAFELLPVMKRVEVNSYLSCPPEILQVILAASQLSYESPSTDWTLSAADSALSLIDQALAFDIPQWAMQLQSKISNITDVDSRIHVASAHRSAACLYILQALPLVRAVRPVDTTMLVDDILNHLSYITEDDPYFKATSWPSFIAGAETRDVEKRTWTMRRLLAIWAICPWGYVFTAIEMLKATWHLQDTTQSPDRGVNWLQDLKGMGFDYLIV